VDNFTNWSFLSILRMLRNNFLILSNGYGVATIIGSVLTIFYLLKQKKMRVLIFIFSFIVPFILTGRFWYGGLFGRYSVMIAYSSALLLALLSFRKVYYVLMFMLLFSFLPTFLIYQKKPIPEIQRDLIKQVNINKDDLLILSDYQRPQLPYPNAIFINDNQKNQQILEKTIEDKLLENARVYISQQAADFPYWQYDGQQIHIVSRGDKQKAKLRKYLQDKELVLAIEDENYPLLKIYQVHTKNTILKSSPQ